MTHELTQADIIRLWEYGLSVEKLKDFSIDLVISLLESRHILYGDEVMRVFVDDDVIYCEVSRAFNTMHPRTPKIHAGSIRLDLSIGWRSSDSEKLCVVSLSSLIGDQLETLLMIHEM